METSLIKESPLPQAARDYPERAPARPLKSKEIDARPVSGETIRENIARSEEALRKVAEGINEFMRSENYSIQFIPHQDSGVVVVKVIDGEGNVVREIPPETMLALASQGEEGIGLLLNSEL